MADDTAMRLFYLASERGASLLPSPTDAGKLRPRARGRLDGAQRRCGSRGLQDILRAGGPDNQRVRSQHGILETKI
jgi:hypothetical protein